MNWWLWIPLFALTAGPITLLLADRILGVPAPKVIRYLGVPALVAFAALIAYGIAQDEPVVRLVAWGALGGLLATIALDIVRLIGLGLGCSPWTCPRCSGSSPWDMPRVSSAT